MSAESEASVRNTRETQLWVNVFERARTIGTVVAIGSGAAAGAGVVLMFEGHPVAGALAVVTGVPVAWKFSRISQDIAIDHETLNQHLFALRQQSEVPQQEA